MKSFSLDFYGGMLHTESDIRDTSLQIANPVPRLQVQYNSQNFLVWAPYDRPIEFDIFKIFNIQLPITIVGWEGAISGFGPVRADPTIRAPEHSGMHTDTWLSIGTPTGKMANGVFGMMKTGDSGAASNSIMGLNLSLNNKLYLNYWCHNMRRSLNTQNADDWHVGYVLYYI